MCTVFPTNKPNHPRAIHPNEITHSTRNLPKQLFKGKAATRNLPKRNRRGDAYVPARTFAQRRFHTKKHTHCARDFNDGCALAGRHGWAHRHRPYQSPSYFSTQTYTNKITICTQSTQTERINNPHNTSGAGIHRALPPPLLKIKKCVYVMIWASPRMTSFALKQIILSVSRG